MRRAGLLVALALAAAGCGGTSNAPPVVQGGDPENGKRLIERYGCGSCHRIPGVKGADGAAEPEQRHLPRRHVQAPVLAGLAAVGLLDAVADDELRRPRERRAEQGEPERRPRQRAPAVDPHTDGESRVAVTRIASTFTKCQ